VLQLIEPERAWPYVHFLQADRQSNTRVTQNADEEKNAANQFWSATAATPTSRSKPQKRSERLICRIRMRKRVTSREFRGRVGTAGSWLLRFACHNTLNASGIKLTGPAQWDAESSPRFRKRKRFKRRNNQ
jgi:hypothetical protein